MSLCFISPKLRHAVTFSRFRWRPVGLWSSVAAALWARRLGASFFLCHFHDGDCVVWNPGDLQGASQKRRGRGHMCALVKSCISCDPRRTHSGAKSEPLPAGPIRGLHNSGPGLQLSTPQFPRLSGQEVGGVDALKPETFESLLPDARAVVMLSGNL